jgi:hypothetical protein
MRSRRRKLPLEVLAAVRARVGDDYVVGIRYLGDDVAAGGSDLEDAVWFGARFAETGVDYLSVSKGGRFEDAKQPKIGEAVYPYTGVSCYECMPTVLSDARGPFGRNVPLAAAIRRRSKQPATRRRWSPAASSPRSSRPRRSSLVQDLQIIETDCASRGRRRCRPHRGCRACRRSWLIEAKRHGFTASHARA